MAIYVYKCYLCEAEKEVRLSMKEIGTHKELCHCGGDTYRVIQPPLIQLKGNGWGSDKAKDTFQLAKERENS